VEQEDSMSADGNKTNNPKSDLDTMPKTTGRVQHLDIDSEGHDIAGRFTTKGKTLGARMHKQHTLDAGADVSSSQDITVPPRGSCIISTGLHLAIPNGCVGLLWSRSGLSVKHNLEVGAGCIDSGYRGEVKVHLYNHSDVSYSVHKGDRIAQLITIPINLNEYIQVESLDDTERGNEGFGSTGVKTPL